MRARAAERAPGCESAGGVGSRRDMEAAIASGRLVVNGARAALGQRVGSRDRVTLDGRPVSLAVRRGDAAPADLPQARRRAGPRRTIRQADRRVRPSAENSGRSLDRDRPARLQHRRSPAVHRLRRARQPPHASEQRDGARVRGAGAGELTREHLRRLAQGIVLEDGPARFDSISPGGGSGSNRWYQVVLREGRNREVRRMFESLGITVSRLMRRALRADPVAAPSAPRPMARARAQRGGAAAGGRSVKPPFRCSG